MVEVQRIVGEFLGLLEGLGEEVTLKVDTAGGHVVLVADGRRTEGLDLAQMIYTAIVAARTSNGVQEELWGPKHGGPIPLGMCG